MSLEAQLCQYRTPLHGHQRALLVNASWVPVSSRIVRCRTGGQGSGAGRLWIFFFSLLSAIARATWPSKLIHDGKAVIRQTWHKRDRRLEGEILRSGKDSIVRLDCEADMSA